MRCVSQLFQTVGRELGKLTSVCLFQDLQRILTRSLDLLYSGTTSLSGLQMDSDYLLVITTMETQILAWQHEWSSRLTGEYRQLRF